MKKNWKIYLSAFLLPIIILIMIYFLWGQYPFGDNTLLIWDMDWQYCSFFAHLHDILHGDASAWYTLSRAIGGDMVGVSAYYLYSPFNLLFYFFNAEHIYVGILVVTLLKVGAIGLCMNSYLMSRRKDSSTLIFSTIYALSAYVIGYSFNIIWLDGVMLLPLVIYGIELLVDKRKCLLYIFTIALGVITNFYTGYMLCIFSVIYFIFYFFLISDEKKKIKTIFSYMGCSVMGGLLSACTTLPTVFAIQGGKSSFSLSSVKDFSRLFGYKDIARCFFMGTIHGIQMTTNQPLVYAGVVSLILLGVFLFAKGISWKKKLAYFLMLLFLVISFNHYNLNSAWQAFNMPNGSPQRFSFIYIFLVLLVASEAYGYLNRATESKKWNTTITLILGGVLLGIVIAFRNDFLLFGRPGIFTLNIAFIVVYTVLIAFLNRPKLRTGIILGLVSIELCLNGYYLYHYGEYYQSTTVTEYKEYIDSVSSLVDEVKEDSELYRTVMTGEAYRSVNDNFMFNLYGLDSYTSVERLTTLEIAYNLGYYNDKVHGIHYKNGSTLAAESLLGVKYKISSENQGRSYQCLDTEGTISLYENNTALPFLFFVDKSIQEAENIDYNVYAYQNDIYSSIEGEVNAPVFEEINTTMRMNENCELRDDGLYHVIDNTKEAFVEYALDVEEAGSVYLHYYGTGVFSAVAVRNGEIQSLDEQEGLVKSLSNLEPGEDVYVRLYISDSFYPETCKIYVENEKTLYSYKEAVEKQQISIEYTDDANISVECTNDYGKGSYLLCTIPVDSGWKVTVDGEEVEVEQAVWNLMLIPVEPGTHIVKLQFIPQGLYAGLGITFGLLILITVSCILKKKLVQKNEERKEA